MNINKFAAMISWISWIKGINFNSNDVEEIGNFIQVMIDEAKEPNLPSKVNLVPMFDAMINMRRIDAIKEYRNLTGFELKESKDEIERLMQSLAR